MCSNRDAAWDGWRLCSTALVPPVVQEDLIVINPLDLTACRAATGRGEESVLMGFPGGGMDVHDFAFSRDEAASRPDVAQYLGRFELARKMTKHKK